MSTSVPHSHPARMEASVCMTGAVSTTVCACQASTDVAVSARLDPVSRQGELSCWDPEEAGLESGSVEKGRAVSRAGD